MKLSSPIQCKGLELCFVQNYMDHNPGPAWQDYRCGHLSYDAHNGTDIRVSYDDMLRGVPVLAASDGLVIAVRDGMEDANVRLKGVNALHGKFAGNTVYLDHNGGVETRYSHLMQGSIAVKVGDFVKRGQMIGKVGLSGNTEFPHVEFGLLVSGEYVDPFVGETMKSCEDTLHPLWDEKSQSMLAYHGRGVLDGAIVNGSPDIRNVLLRPKHPFHPDLGNRMTLWGAFFGVRSGDVMRMVIIAPGGRIATDRTLEITANFAQKIASVSIRAKRKWPSGTYVGRCELQPGDGGAPLVFERQVTVP